jgi:hypothetical protein
MVGEDSFQLAGEASQPVGQRFGCVGLELPIGDMSQPIALGTDQPPPGRAEPWIKAEDERQPNFSNSSSLIS